MATDPQQLLMALAGSTGLGQQIADNAQNQQIQQTLGQQAIQQGQYQQQQQVQQEQAAQQFQHDVLDYNQDPTPQKLSALAMRYPQQAQNFTAAAKLKDDAQRNADLTSYGQIYNAATNGRKDLVVQQLQQRQQAMRAAGQDTSNIDDALQQLANGGDEALKNVKGIALSQIYSHDPDGFSKAFNLKDGDGSPEFTNTPQGNIYDKHTGLGPHGESYSYGGGGDSASSGGAADGSGGPVRDISRIVNTDAGGGQVPDSVKTLGQFVTWGKALNAKGAKSSSAGTYQINGSTMAEFAPQALGANWKSQPFNADAQDKVGEAIFDWAKQQKDPAAALAGRWVSLSKAKAAQLVKGSWNDAKGAIAAGETGGGAGASANAGGGAQGAFQAPLVARYGKAQPGYRWRADGSEEPIPGGSKDASGAPTSGALDPDTVTTMAQQYLAGDKTVFTNLGRGQQGAANIVAVRKEITRQARAQGLDGKQIAQQMQTFNAAQKTLNAFDAGKEGGITRSLNVAIDHLDTLQNAAQALQNGRIPVFNQVAQAWARATGSPAPTNFEATRQIVAGEVAKVIAGGNSALADRKELVDHIRTSASPQQLAGYIAQAKALLGGQLHGLAQQYQTGTGRNDFGARLSPRTRTALGYGSSSSGATRTATGPNGQKLGLIGGKWVTIQ